MTIKQQGGIFGRNPTFNDLTVEGTLSVPSDSISGDAIDGGTATLDGLTVDTNTLYVDEINHRLGIGTSTPGTKVEVYAPAGTSSDLVMRLRATDGAASYGSVVDLTTTATGSQVADFIIATRDGSNITETLRCKGNGDVSVNRGNLVIGTSGKGIDFSATSGTGTSELFDDYEEGTYTPALEGMTGGAVTYTSQFGRYTKIGRQVNVFFFMHVNTNTNTGGNTGVSVPFVPDVGGSNYIYVGPIGRNTTSNSVITHVSFFSGIARALFFTPALGTLNGSAVTNGSVLSGSITYFV